MIPEDLPTSASWQWQQHGGDWWVVPEGASSILPAVAVLISRQLLILPLSHKPPLRTPTEVRAYFTARPNVPCPFRFYE